MYFLTPELYFPPSSETSPEGIIAVGGDLSSERLLLAYQNGIFPWYDSDEPKLWWCPKKRMVLFFENLRITKSMKKVLLRNEFQITFNTNFRAVISNCQKSPRKNQDPADSFSSKVFFPIHPRPACWAIGFSITGALSTKGRCVR